MFKMKPRNLIFLLFSLSYIIFRGVEGYKESKSWKATYIRDGEARIINSSEGAQIFEDFKTDYLAQQNIDEKKVSLEIIDRIEKIIIDDQISVHELMDELERLEQILYNPFLTNEGREHLNTLREVIVSSLEEYGKENPAFLGKFNEAEIALKEYREFRLDPDVVNLQKIIVEEGLEKFFILAKKMSQTNEGRVKLQKIFGNSTMDGQTFLEMLDKSITPL